MEGSNRDEWEMNSKWRHYTVRTWWGLSGGEAENDGRPGGNDMISAFQAPGAALPSERYGSEPFSLLSSQIQSIKCV